MDVKPMESIADLVKAFTQMEEQREELSELTEAFENDLDHVMLKYGFIATTIGKRLHFLNNSGDTYHVLDIQPNEITMWEFPKSEYRHFEFYLRDFTTPKVMLMYVGMMVGFFGGGVLLKYISPYISTNNTTNPTLSPEAFLFTGMVCLVGVLGFGAITGWGVYKYITKLENKNAQKFQPIATGIEALEKVAELYKER
jgi:hypothetical protein